MKQHVILVLAAVWISITAQQVLAQAPKQKIFPTDLKKAAFFSSDNHYADNTLFISDPEYKTTDVSRGCNIGYGAMNIYKQINGNWTFNQLLLPDYGTTLENKLASRFSYKNNLLVCSAEREDYSATTTRAGAIYIYKRSGESAAFSRIAKIFAPSPAFGGEFSGNGVATNGSNIVVYNQAASQLCLYNVSGTAVTLASVINIGNTAGYIQGITDNNIVVIQNGNAVRLFRIDGNLFTEITASTIPLTGTQILGSKASVNGNTVVFEAYNTFPSGSRHGFIRIVKLGYSSVESISDISFPLGLSYNNSTTYSNSTITEVYIRENASIAVGISKGSNTTYRNRVALLNYTDGKYRLADVLEAPTEYSSVMSDNWAKSIALSSSQIFIGDFSDRTNYITPTGSNYCPNQNASGALYVYDIRQAVTNGINGSRVLTTVFKDVDDRTGEDVSVSGNYALVSQPYSDDIDEDAGAVSLMKNLNGQWYLQKKLHSTTVTTTPRENFGNSVSISSSFAAIGAKYRNSSRGLVHVLQVLSPSGVKIEDAIANYISAPDEADFNYFGGVVATDGNYLAVSATGDDTQGSESGAVYIFNWNGSNWNFIQKIIPPTFSAYQSFGTSISLKGNFLAIGAPYDDNAKGTDAGAVHLYQLNSGTFVYTQKLIPANTGNTQVLGKTVTISTDYLAVGSVNYGNTIGYVNIFKRSLNNWLPDAVLSGSTGNSAFGSNCAVDGTRLLVASPEEGKVNRYERTTSWVKTGGIALAGSANGHTVDVAISGDNTVIGNAYNSLESQASLVNFFSISGARLSFSTDDHSDDTFESAGVYPNPVIGGLVKLYGVKDVQRIEAYSMSGTNMGSLPMNEAQEVDITSLKPGLYILLVQEPDQTRNLKLMVK